MFQTTNQITTWYQSDETSAPLTYLLLIPTKPSNNFGCQNCQSYSALYATWPCAALSSVACFGIYDVIYVIWMFYAGSYCLVFICTGVENVKMWPLNDWQYTSPSRTIGFSIRFLEASPDIFLSFQLSGQCHWLDLSSTSLPPIKELKSHRGVGRWNGKIARSWLGFCEHHVATNKTWDLSDLTKASVISVTSYFLGWPAKASVYLSNSNSYNAGLLWLVCPHGYSVKCIPLNMADGWFQTSPPASPLTYTYQSVCSHWTGRELLTRCSLTLKLPFTKVEKMTPIGKEMSL